MDEREERYKWQRGWIAPEGRLSLVDEAWLPEQSSPFYPADPGVVTLADLAEHRCLMLLGEPGSGKSVAMGQAARHARETEEAAGVVEVDLGSAETSSELQRMILEQPEVVAHLAGSGQLHLFLDALDEAKIAVRTAVSVLEHCLSDFDPDRLTLRVSCRTAERQPGLESWLTSRFGEQSFKALELCPLRISDAREAAQKRDIDASEFLDGVAQARVAALAARPLTLGLLLDVYADDGSLPEKLTDLYEKALLLMVTEPDPERKPWRKLSATQAFTIAARVAAGTVLCGRDSVGTDGTPIQELLGGEDLDRLIGIPTNVQVDEIHLKEVLDTGLFSARARDIGWAHRTFGEFLTAYWLSDERISIDQLGDLLLALDGTGRRVVPSMRSVVGWLAAFRPEILDMLDAKDLALPALFGDPASIPQDTRERSVRSLLDAIEDRELEPSAVRPAWARLRHAGLADQLAQALVNPQEDFRKREAALDAVAAVPLCELAETVADIALDHDAPVTLRSRALNSLRDYAEKGTRERVMSLACEPQPEDPDDEIKGSALRLCWPTELSAAQLFSGLTPEKNESLLGSYTMFLRTECAEHITSEADLLEAIAWSMGVPREWHGTRDVGQLADGLVLKAWPVAADSPAIAGALADLVLMVGADHEPLLTSAPSLLSELEPAAVLSDANANREILRALVGRIPALDLDPDRARQIIAQYMTSTGALMEDALLQWQASEGEQREAWAIAIEALSWNNENADVLFEAREQFPQLFERISWRYAPVLIDSPAAEAMREQWRGTTVLRNGPPIPESDPSEYDEQVAAEMEAFAAGDVGGYWRMQLPLMADDSGRVRGREFANDLTSTPGWQRIFDSLRQEIIAGAQRYLEEADPEPKRWLGKQQVFWPAWAGYCALRLLWRERPNAFERLSERVWRKWTPIVICWPDQDDSDPEFRADVIAHVRREAPEEARASVTAALGSSMLAGSVHAAIARLGDLWDDAMDEALFKLLKRRKLETYEAAMIVEHLGRKAHEPTLSWAYRRIKRGAQEEQFAELALTLADTIAKVDPTGFWVLLRRAVKSDPAWARRLLGRVAERGTPAVWSDGLQSAQRGELFAILSNLFPPRAETQAERRGAVTIETEASFWRGRLLAQLADEGTQEAVAILGKLEADFDSGGWIRRIGHRAHEELRRASWVPPQPRDVIGLPGEERRLLGDSGTLRMVVLRMLEDLAAEMQGAHPKAPLLWNTRPSRRPKSENEISDVLAILLREKLADHRAFINREVQINPVAESGDRTDLLVQAIAADESEIAVVVEVKGAWNQKLMAAMSAQLARKYLKPDLTEDGIYLVLWFTGTSWDANTSGERQRRTRATRTGSEDLQDLLDEQAVEVSRQSGATVSALVLDASLPVRERE